MSEFAETPREELEKKYAKKRPVVRQEEEEKEETTTVSLDQVSQLVAAVIQNEAKVDPAFAKELNAVAVQARLAAERLIDQKQLWKTASFGEKVKLAPSMARAALLMSACNTITQGIYAGATEQAVAQAKADGSWTPEDVSRISGWMRELDSPREPTLSVSMPDFPQVQPPTLSTP